MKNKNFGRKRQAIYILSNRKSTRIIKTLMDFFFFIKVKIKMVCFSVPSLNRQRAAAFCAVCPLDYPEQQRQARLGLLQILSLYDLSEKLLTQTKTTIAVAMSNSARITEAFHISK